MNTCIEPFCIKQVFRYTNVCMTDRSELHPINAERHEGQASKRLWLGSGYRESVDSSIADEKICGVGRSRCVKKDQGWKEE